MLRYFVIILLNMVTFGIIAKLFEGRRAAKLFRRALPDLEAWNVLQKIGAEFRPIPENIRCIWGRDK